MAQRAMAIISGIWVNEDDSKVNVQAIVAISGSDIGNYGSGRVVLDISGLSPAALTFKTDLAAAIKAELIASGVGFGTLNIDTVSLY